MGLVSLVVLAQIVGTLSLSVVKKCCGPEESLSLNKTCIESGHRWFYMNFTYGMPNCNFSYKAAVEGKNASCIDNLLDSNLTKTVALECNADPFIFTIPNVNYIPKCCPMTRSYDTIKQTCYGEGSGNSWPRDLINVLLGGFKDIVDIRIGSPNCTSDHTIYDYLVPLDQIRREESESIVFRTENGSEIRMNPDELCVDLTEKQGVIVVRACLPRKYICNKDKGILCINKCCQDGYSIKERQGCLPSTASFDHEYAFSLVENGLVEHEFMKLSFTYKDPCPSSKYKIDDEEKDEIFIDEHGIYYSESLQYGTWEAPYCIDQAILESETKSSFFSCLPDKEPRNEYAETQSYLTGIGMFISCCFMFAMLLVYSCLPSLRNLHGKTLMTYVSCLLIAYSLLTFLKLNPGAMDFSDAANISSIVNLGCKIIGYLLEFFFLAAFSWLNVICFDIWWTFGTMRPALGRRARERKKYIIYSIYAWIIPSLFTISAFVVDYLKLLPAIYRLDVGSETCFFSVYSNGKHIFFYLPELIMLSSNIVFFILTAKHCAKVKLELASMAHSALAEKKFKSDKERFKRDAKLFLVMGINWIFEFISVYTEYYIGEIWFLSDLLNALLGLLIFWIFILKKNVLKAFKRRIMEIICHVRKIDQRPSTCSSVLNNSSITVISSECKKPHPLRKSTSDSRLSVGVPSPKKMTHHRCISSNTLFVDQRWQR